MITSLTPFLSELAAGHAGPPIPFAKRAYFQQRLRIRLFNFILDRFVMAQKAGLTKAILARRIEKTPDLVNRWLGAPTNLTVDTICDLLIGISAEELQPATFSPIAQVRHNYSHFADLSAEPDISRADNQEFKPSAEDADRDRVSAFHETRGALVSGSSDYGQKAQKATILGAS